MSSPADPRCTTWIDIRGCVSNTRRAQGIWRSGLDVGVKSGFFFNVFFGVCVFFVLFVVFFFKVSVTDFLCFSFFSGFPWCFPGVSLVFSLV